MHRRDFVKLGMGAGATALAGWTTHASADFDFDHFRMDEWRKDSRVAKTRFGSISYTMRGSGDPALFLHGFPLSGFQWRGPVEQLELFYCCIVPDFLGLGATEASSGQDFGAAAQAAMLIAFLDALKVDRVHVVANDSGCTVAQLLAARHPDRVRSLLLTNGDTERQSPPPAMLPVIDLSRKGQFAGQWLAPWYASHAHARAADQFGGMCYADPRNPSDAAIEMYFGPLLATPERRRQVEAHAVAQASNALVGITPALNRCQVPVRIVWGMADTIFDPGNADYLDKAFGASRGVRRLDRSKLFWPEERPDVIAEEADTLWRKVRA